VVRIFLRDLHLDQVCHLRRKNVPSDRHHCLHRHPFRFWERSRFLSQLLWFYSRGMERSQCLRHHKGQPPFNRFLVQLEVGLWQMILIYD
jgi:hypothetical protein